MPKWSSRLLSIGAPPFTFTGHVRAALPPHGATCRTAERGTAMSSVLRAHHLSSRWRLLVVAAIAVVAGSGLWAPSAAHAAVGVPTSYQDQTFASGVAS